MPKAINKRSRSRTLPLAKFTGKVQPQSVFKSYSKIIYQYTLKVQKHGAKNFRIKAPMFKINAFPTLNHGCAQGY